MVQKFQKYLVNRYSLYNLGRMIEFEEGCFTIESSKIEQKKGIRGRGAVRKFRVVINAESTTLENIETGEKSSHCRCFKVKVLTNHTANQLMKQYIN